MATPTKGKALHVWVQDDTASQLKALSDATDIAESQIAGRIIAAGLQAILKNGNRLTLPVTFSVIADTHPPPEPIPNRKEVKAKTV